MLDVPGGTRGELVGAYVVPRAGCELDLPGLRRFLRSRLAPHKVPRRIRVLPNLPLNASGKVDKRLLRERWPEPGARGGVPGG